MSIQTPCVGICKIHDEFKVCIGCFRTRLQIAKWHNSSDEEKLTIIAITKIKKEALDGYS